jgi:hypothetical protein
MESFQATAICVNSSRRGKKENKSTRLENRSYILGDRWTGKLKQKLSYVGSGFEIFSGTSLPKPQSITPSPRPSIYNSYCCPFLQTKAEEFLNLTRKTIVSYFATWGDDDPQEKSEEFQFVLALCGIITNIAAAPCGREFFTKKENGQALVDCLVTSLEKTSVRCNVKIRSLMLMALYNIR